MPIYEYVAEQCGRQPACSRRKEVRQGITEPALEQCPDCGAAIRRIMSSFASRSGSVGASSPDPTPLNTRASRLPPFRPAAKAAATMIIDEQGVAG